MAYPTIHYSLDSTTARPNILVIVDSYYHVLHDMGIPQQLFTPDAAYWHYFEREVSLKHPEGIPINKQR
ncbi:MAG: hypothetical protein AAF694_09500 [Bacteroidota bacterium]